MTLQVPGNEGGSIKISWTHRSMLLKRCSKFEVLLDKIGYFSFAFPMSDSRVKNQVNVVHLHALISAFVLLSAAA